MRDATTGFALRGTFMHAPRRGEIEIMEDAVVSVDAAGTIDAVHRPGEAGHTAAVADGHRRGTLVEFGEGQYVLPGLVDLHIHAPQWPQLGKALHLPLDQWLLQCTFPLEARYADRAYAEQVYTSLVDTLLANGTTTAVYFATVHVESTMRLADICLAKGQRGLVGKVAMDDPHQCPDYYRDASATAAIEGTRDLIAYVQALPGNEAGLVRPVITPRFIPSCTDRLLEGLGALAQETACHVQTHCSEGDWEHAFVVERLGRTDTHALHDFGLLRPNTILAHSNFITDEDMDLIGHVRAGIAHCPWRTSTSPMRHSRFVPPWTKASRSVSAATSRAVRVRPSSTTAAMRSLHRGLSRTESTPRSTLPIADVPCQESISESPSGWRPQGAPLP